MSNFRSEIARFCQASLSPVRADTHSEGVARLFGDRKAAANTPNRPEAGEAEGAQTTATRYISRYSAEIGFSALPCKWLKVMVSRPGLEPGTR